MEQEGEVHTLVEIHQNMVEIAGSEDSAYGIKWLKTKLKARYAEHVSFVQSDGSTTKVCFKNMVDYLINDKWYQDKLADTDDEAERIIVTASKLIMADIRSKNYDCEVYPCKESISDIDEALEWISPYLCLLLQNLVKSKLKQVAFGQAIIQTIRQRTCISPVLLGIGIDTDHVFGSRWLVDFLSRFGFSSSYDEIRRYKQSVLKHDELEIKQLEGGFVQWSADNVDHNVCTLSGKGSLHGMGIICSVTTKSGRMPLQTSQLKREKIQRMDKCIKNKGIVIKQYLASTATGLSKVKFKDLSLLKLDKNLSLDYKMDFFWDSAYFFRNYTRPNWSGFMSTYSAGEYPGRSKVLFLPIIDLSPSDPSCIFTTLEFVIEQAKSLNIQTPVITFDQPLWLNATEIATAKSMQIVIILGGFHLMMSYMGSVGSLMKGSGLEEALGTCYGSNTVDHMITGKAVSRALRGHFLTASSLQVKLMTPLFPSLDCEDYIEGTNEGEESDLDYEEKGESAEEIENEADDEIYEERAENSDIYEFATLKEEELEKLEILFEDIKKSPAKAPSLVADSKEIQILTSRYEEYEETLKEKSRTAKFWLQYLRYINILKLFIRAERTGNWTLHLVSVSKMINLFAATGHVHYKKKKNMSFKNRAILFLRTFSAGALPENKTHAKIS